MQNEFDAIIIGGGHNGLVTAVTLARAGYNVLIVERRTHLGGAAATVELFPGCRVNVGAQDAALFPDRLTADLGLADAGLTFSAGDALLFAPQPDGPALTLWRDEERTAAGLAAHSPRDAAQYPAFLADVRRHAAHLETLLWLPPPRLTAPDLQAWAKAGLSDLPPADLLAFWRVLSLPVKQYLEEWFEGEALKGALASTAVWGSRHGPWASGTNFMLLYQAVGGSLPGARFVQGGMGALSQALAQAAEQAGATIRTDTAVAQILLNDGKAAGVRTAAGETIHADRIISNAPPRATLFDLVGPHHLEPRVMRAVRSRVYRGTTATLHLLLRGLPRFNGQTEAAQLDGHIVIAPSLAYIEKASDAAKYGRFSPHPILDITLPTRHTPDLAPPGHHLMSVQMQYAPYHLRQSDWEKERPFLAKTILNTLTAYAPDLPDLVVRQKLLTPLDWEQTYGLTEGHMHHGEMGLAQLSVLRPLPNWSRYQTPIPHLYLCGAGTHPGGGVTGIPGHLAAQEILGVMHDA